MHSRRIHTKVAFLARFAALFTLAQLLVLGNLPAVTPGVAAQGDIIFVNDDAVGLNNGGNWKDAFRKLQNALAIAGDGDQIWVAAGIYFPDEMSSTDSNFATATFQLKPGVAIYGGFAGTEMQLVQRNIDANFTLLSGDLQQNDDRDEKNIMDENGNKGTNATHVVSAIDVPTSARLDGFTITGGVALGDGSTCPSSCGGGFYSSEGSATLANVTFNGNIATYGAGALLNNDSPSTWEHISFLRNWSKENGGGIFFAKNADALLRDVHFSENHANTAGGAIFIDGGILRLANVILAGNRAQRGSAIFNTGAVHLFNVTIAGNQTEEQSSSALYNTENADGSLNNSIVWGNRTNGGVAANVIVDPSASLILQHSLVEGGIPPNGEDSGGNLNADPLFVRTPNCGSDNLCADLLDNEDDEDYGDLRLRAASPAVDAGDNEYADDIPTDLVGNPRVIAIHNAPARVDMGAYEKLNSTPVGNAGGPYTVNEGTPLTLVGSGSTDEDNPIVTYAWDCTNDGSNEVTSPSATNSTCTYPNDGTATLKLTVTDQWGATHEATTGVTILNVNPTFTAAPDQSAFAATAKTFSLGNFTDPGADAPWQVTVEWGDATPASQFEVVMTGALTAAHTYTSEGSYNVTVTVSDDFGSSSDGFVARVSPATGGIGDEQIFIPTIQKE